MHIIAEQRRQVDLFKGVRHQPDRHFQHDDQQREQVKGTECSLAEQTTANQSGEDKRKEYQRFVGETVGQQHEHQCRHDNRSAPNFFLLAPQRLPQQEQAIQYEG